MLENHIIAGMHHLVGTIVVSTVASERQGIALLKADMSESHNRIFYLKEVGTVAPQLRAGMREVYLTSEYLCSWYSSPLVVSQLISVLQIHTFVGFLALLLFVGAATVVIRLKPKRHRIVITTTLCHFILV